ncbi:cupin domain-containing protein [Desulfosarcina sp.]|uniref:cupin domain-containing protein n=1 Tax=Desulfosarcina sp. TaxID=2027861 RepID=UPI003970AEAC
MATKISRPSIIEAAGNRPKRIEEYIGRVNSGTEAVSVARMVSPAGWQEPGQCPDFEEYTVVLGGMLRVETRDGALEIRAGEAVIAHAGQWVRYSTPEPEGAVYIAVCRPAFSEDAVYRDDAS